MLIKSHIGDFFLFEFIWIKLFYYNLTNYSIIFILLINDRNLYKGI